MKNWKTVLAAGIILLIGLEILRPKSDHASPMQAISVANGAPSGSCTAPLIYMDSTTARIYMCNGSNVWIPLLPSGTMTMSLSGCGAGWVEATALSGKFLQGTTSANSDAGTSGGSVTQNFTTATNVSLVGVGTALVGPSTINLSPPFTKVIFCQLP